MQTSYVIIIVCLKNFTIKGQPAEYSQVVRGGGGGGGLGEEMSDSGESGKEGGEIVGAR